MHKISSYKHLLNLIIEFETEEESFRGKRFQSLAFFFVCSSLILLSYIIYKWDSGLEVSKELVGIALSPVFSYLLRSYEEDYLNQRRAYLLTLINETITTPATGSSFVDEDVKFETIKEIIRDALKAQL